MQRNWDWLVRQISDRVRIASGSLPLAGFAALALLATAWLLWPLRDSSELTPFFVATSTVTSTRAIAYREPTPTAFVPTLTPLPLIHVVQEGEVLGIVAEEYGTTVEALLAANDLEDADLISIGQELVIPDAQGTPQAVEVAIPTPTVTPTAPYVYDAPVPLAPQDQAVFRGREAAIHLQWASVAFLKEKEWYEVQLWLQDQETVYRVWTKASSWTVPAWLYPADGGGLVSWNVAIVYREAQQSIQLSRRSRSLRFEWR